jgi:coenzyme F420-reducing hydrogenase delta subunit
MMQLSEKSSCIARLAMVHLLAAIDCFYDEGDPQLFKSRADVQEAINELGVMNNRMQVLYDSFRARWRL